jgi:predicted RNase H-like nuclease (RuvC/YqgF family)
MISYDEISKNSDIASIFIEQSQIDLNRMRELNKANRLYRKCIFGNCPTQDNTRILQNKERFVSISKKALDSKLTQVWSNKGRKRRLRNLSNEISDLELKIKVATAKPYTKERESDFYAIEERIKRIKTKEDEIEKMKMEINHLKSQIVRLDQKRDELSHETESEGDYDKIY